MGGHLGGEIASAIAVAEAHKALVSFAVMAGSEKKQLLRVVQHANNLVEQYGRQHPEVDGLGTTLVIAELLFGKLWIAHIGDSRAYLLSNGKLSPLTRDHANGRFISKAIGMMGPHGPDISDVDVQRGDKLMLCSDGLTNAVPESDIANVMRSHRKAKDVCRALVNVTLASGAPDNVSVVVVRFG